MTETIFALASAPGRGGVAVIRVSGPAAKTVIKELAGGDTPAPRMAVLRAITDPLSGALIDRGLVLFFAGPHSFTGEDIAEFHLHGGLAVTDAMLEVLARLQGCRMAEPGEFTRRAFENGKMDLTAAEAVADLVDAETEAQRMQALDQMGGGLAALYTGWRERLARTLAYIEADIDFPDEDLPAGIAEAVRPDIGAMKAEILAHLSDNRRGERLRNGITVAVIGAPNAGKSSLVNFLAQRDVAIVSPQAGTTRDIIEAHLNLGGLPFILADTAGLRPDQLSEEGQDGIESEGIRRALQRAQEADIRLLLFDANKLPVIDSHTRALAGENALIAFNKADQAAAPIPDMLDARGTLAVSVKSGAGLDSLMEALVDKAKKLLGTKSGPSLTRRRHRDALEQCIAALERAETGVEAELIAEDVRLAIRFIGRITGRVDVEELLDVIFRDFCIGK